MSVKTNQYCLARRPPPPVLGIPARIAQNHRSRSGVELATTEHSINDALAEVLRTTRRVWSSSTIVSSENTGMLKGNSKRPDILVIEPHVSPVVIETEILPAATVEIEAVSRLGEHLRSTGRIILS